MKPTNAPVDLNLLRVFLAVWDLRSLTAAGDRLGLTQPAISHALRRLRDRFGDPLFVRVGNRMLPTDAAVRMHEPLDRAFELLDLTLHGDTVFDPWATERTFRVAMSDIAEAYFLPRLATELSRISPSVRIDVVPLLPASVVGAMRSGEVDLAIGAVGLDDKDCMAVDAFSDRYICLVRTGHPIAKAALTRSDFAKLRFFYARTTSAIHQMAEQWLADEDARPRIAVRGHFTTAPEIVRNSDLAAIFPRLLALDVRQPRDFRMLELPFDLPAMEIKVYRHARFANDSGIRWACDVSATLLRKAASGRDGPGGRRSAAPAA